MRGILNGLAIELGVWQAASRLTWPEWQIVIYLALAGVGIYYIACLLFEIRGNAQAMKARERRLKLVIGSARR